MRSCSGVRFVSDCTTGPLMMRRACLNPLRAAGLALGTNCFGFECFYPQNGNCSPTVRGSTNNPTRKSAWHLSAKTCIRRDDTEGIYSVKETQTTGWVDGWAGWWWGGEYTADAIAGGDHSPLGLDCFRSSIPSIYTIPVKGSASPAPRRRRSPPTMR